MGASSSVIKSTEEISEGVVFDFYAKYKSPDAYELYAKMLKEMEEAEKEKDTWRTLCCTAAHH